MKKKMVLKIGGMDCSSCVINIDGVLEDQVGVFESRTSYAKQQTNITFDSDKVSAKKLLTLVKSTGYKVEVLLA